MAEPAVFYFDFLSPYAYLAAERIDELIPEAEWKPIPFPILMKERGRLEEVLARDPRPRLEEVRERAAERGLPPVEPPAVWPREAWSLAPLRAAVWAGEQGRLKEFSLAAFRKVFVEGRALTEIDTICDAAGEAELDPDEAAAAIERPEIKHRLKDNTAEAFARGVNGIPTVAIGDRLFWGDDQLVQAAAAARTQ